MNLQSCVMYEFVWDEEKQDFVSVPEERYYANGEEITREEYYSILEDWEEQANAVLEDGGLEERMALETGAQVNPDKTPRVGYGD